MRKKTSRVQKFNQEKRSYDIEQARKERLDQREKHYEERKRENPLKDNIKYDNNGKEKRHLNKVKLLKTVVALLIITVIGFSGKSIVDLTIEKKQLEARQQALKIEKQNLETELENIDSLEYIEEQARIQLKLIKPGETLYLVEDNENKDKDGEKE